MAHAAANVSLQLAKRIPERNLLRTDTEDQLSVLGMFALSADEVLLACSGRMAMGAVSLHTGQLAALDLPFIPFVWGVAFDAQTDTLLLLVSEPTVDNFRLVSLSRNAGEWFEVQRLDTRIHNNNNIAMCDSRVLLVQGNTLYEFDVSAEHTLRDAGNATLQSETSAVACISRDGDTLVALRHVTSVSLQWLASPLRLEPLANVSLTEPYQLLFHGDLLLVSDYNSGHFILSFSASDNALTERRVLIDAQANVRVVAWTIAGDRLVLSDLNSNELRVYAFT